MAADEGRVGVHFDEFFGERAVGARVGGGGEDDGDVEEGAERGVGVDVVLVERGVPVAGDVVESDLDVEDEEELGRIRGRWYGRGGAKVPSCSCQDVPMGQLCVVRKMQPEHEMERPYNLPEQR